MELSSPIVFEPLFMERVWGGRRLETLSGKRLPVGSRIGESWEIVDREEAQSVVHDGPLRGATLHELWRDHREAIFGCGIPDSERFPLLCKVLDAQERLSVQVHPPASLTEQFGGQPKTEMWYVMEALADSTLYAGLKRGSSKALFEEALHAGRLAEHIHEMPVKKGDALFIPSGRVHAIGAGNLIVEIQQNSDTTYRLFDWNRIGFDGRPRNLHVEESLAAINFEDVEPQKLAPESGELLVQCDFFRVEKWRFDAPRAGDSGNRFAIFAVVDGKLSCGGREFEAGAFFFVPPVVAYGELKPCGEVTLLRASIP